MLLTILGLQLVIVGLLLAVLFIKPDETEVIIAKGFEADPSKEAVPPKKKARRKKYQRSGKYTKEAIAKRKAATAHKRFLRRKLKEAEREAKKLQ